jgi:hypothetical protein
MPVTFDVSPEVRPESEPIKATGSVHDAVHALTKVKPEAAGSNSSTGLLPFHSGPYETEKMHGFLLAVHSSFNSHYPLTLSPDDVWLTIAQGFAAHVNANAEKLRKQFVKHEGKLYIEIRRDDFKKGSPSNDWPGGFSEFSDKIAEHIGKKRDLLVSNFSTTDIVEKAASELVLMDAMSQYFDYGMRTYCGIPKITLLGNINDWQNIRERAQTLAEFDCKNWVSALTPVLDHFVKAHKGLADPKFWQSFYKLGGGSGGPYVTGFINVLFPYLARGYANRACLKWEDGIGFMGGGPNTDDFPSGMSQVPFKWIYFGEEFKMQFLGGFVGASQEESGALRPSIGWAVADRVGE